jgi:uncharacterized membrane protein
MVGQPSVGEMGWEASLEAIAVGPSRLGSLRMTMDRRSILYFLGKVVFAAPFLISGVGHFAKTQWFVRIMPPYLPYHRELVLVSGACEIVLAILLLIPATTRLAAWGLIALLIAIFPANIYVYQNQQMFPLPGWVHLLRLPLQGVLILWAYAYARR